MAYIGHGLTLNQGNIILPETTTAVDGEILVNSTALGGPTSIYNSFRIANGNFIMGPLAGNLTYAATNNVGFGALVLSNITTGDANVAIGNASLLALTSGDENVGIGNDAFNSNATGSFNVAIGSEALTATGTGDGNVAIGYRTGTNYNVAESNNILIGREVPGINAESNAIHIGNVTGALSHTACYIGGIYGVTTLSATTSSVLISDDGQLGTIVSSQRFKDNIEDMESSDVMDLRPVNFTYKSDKTNTIQYGLIAEEVAEVMPELVIYDKEGKPFSVKYHDLPAILLNELQKLALEVEQLKLALNQL